MCMLGDKIIYCHGPFDSNGLKMMEGVKKGKRERAGTHQKNHYAEAA